MGMYTELIFGASLKKDTPAPVINAIKYMCGELDVKPSDFPLPDGCCTWLFQGGSYYFAVSSSVVDFRKDDISNEWVLSARCNIKNYGGEIETFLEWVKPFIESGSGSRDMYAMTIYEEDATPTLYFLEDE